jgi:hypothetical protein
VYEVDRCIVYCLLLKVTERHMKPCTQTATKVNWSLPVITKTVAAAINTVVIESKGNCTVSFNDT